MHRHGSCLKVDPKDDLPDHGQEQFLFRVVLRCDDVDIVRPRREHILHLSKFPSGILEHVEADDVPDEVLPFLQFDRVLPGDKKVLLQVALDILDPVDPLKLDDHKVFKVAHMLFEMENLYGLAPYVDKNGDIYLKFGFDIRTYREIMEKYESLQDSDTELKISEEDQAEIDEICGSLTSPDSAIDLDNAIYAWAMARKAREKGLVDENTYDAWKYKYPVYANIDDDGKPEIYEENQAMITFDTNE